MCAAWISSCVEQHKACYTGEWGLMDRAQCKLIWSLLERQVWLNDCGIICQCTCCNLDVCTYKQITMDERIHALLARVDHVSSISKNASTSNVHMMNSMYKNNMDVMIRGLVTCKICKIRLKCSTGYCDLFLVRFWPNPTIDFH